MKGNRSSSLQMAGRGLRKGESSWNRHLSLGKSCGSKLTGEGLFREPSKVTEPTAASVRAGLLAGAPRARKRLQPLQPAPSKQTQRHPRLLSRRGRCAALNVTGVSRMPLCTHVCVPAAAVCASRWSPHLSARKGKEHSRRETVRGGALRTGQAPRPLSRAKPSRRVWRAGQVLVV